MKLPMTKLVYKSSNTKIAFFFSKTNFYLNPICITLFFEIEIYILPKFRCLTSYYKLVSFSYSILKAEKAYN